VFRRIEQRANAVHEGNRHDLGTEFADSSKALDP
jgi:hypothetical protein